MSKFTDADEFAVMFNEEYQLVTVAVNYESALTIRLGDVPAIASMLMQAYYEGKHIDSN